MKRPAGLQNPSCGGRGAFKSSRICAPHSSESARAHRTLLLGEPLAPASGSGDSEQGLEATAAAQGSLSLVFAPLSAPGGGGWRAEPQTLEQVREGPVRAG